MPPFDDTARLARMTEWAKTIASEIADDLQQHYIFWQVQDIIRANPQLTNARSHFFQWMGDVFVASAAVAVRRQTDNSDDSVCLRRLLREAREYPHIVTRAHYLSLCGASDDEADFDNSSFDQWAGEAGGHLDTNLVEADLQSLLDVSERIRHYANKRVAHYDRRGVTPGMMPTFDDLDEAYRVIEGLTQKYHLILTGVWIGQLRPTIIYPWKDVFRVPWIPR